MLWDAAPDELRGVERSRPSLTGADPNVVVHRVGDGTLERCLRQHRSRRPSPTPTPVAGDISAGLDVTDGAATLRHFRDRPLGTLVVATALGAAFGYATVRWTLHRFDGLGHALRGLTAERLGQRLDEAAFPDEFRSHAQGYNAMVDRLERSFDRLKAFAAGHRT